MLAQLCSAARQQRRIDRPHIAAVLCLDLATQVIHRPHRPAHHQPDCRATHRNEEDERQEQGNRSFPQGFVAIVDGIGHLDEDRAIIVCRGIEPKVLVSTRN